MAKLFATEHAWKICDIALQVHGGYGYVRDFPVERALRDVRATRIYDDPADVTSYPEEASLHIWDQHRFGALDLAAEATR